MPDVELEPRMHAEQSEGFDCKCGAVFSKLNAQCGRHGWTCDIMETASAPRLEGASNTYLIHQVLSYRAESRAMMAEERGTMTEARVRELAEAELCRIVAEWEWAIAGVGSGVWRDKVLRNCVVQHWVDSGQ